MPAEYSDVTRSKILSAAGTIFAEQGYQATTIREICRRAGANVAAVNYYFKDKLGLYTEALRQAVCAAENDALHKALGQSATPEAALRKFIEVMLHRMFGKDHSGRNIRIMAHEIARPTPALPRVIDEVMRPNYQKLREIIAQLLGLEPEDDTTRLCAHSVIGQVVHYVIARPVIHRLWPGFEMTPKRLEQVTTHIADFTLCSLHTLAKQRNQNASRGTTNGRTSSRRNEAGNARKANRGAA